VSSGVGDDGPLSSVRARRGRLRWLFVSIGWLAVVATAFVLGHLLAAHDAERALARIQALQNERDLLSEQLAAQRGAQTKLERTHQMDVVAQRAAQRQILQLEDERMRLEQQVAQLRALLGAGEQGVVDVDELMVSPAGDGVYRYRLTLSQLVPNFGRTEGTVALYLLVDSGEGRSVLPLAELGEDSAGRHAMSFEHFQVFDGKFRLGTGIEPIDLIVEIVPKDDTLLGAKEVVGWRAALASPKSSVKVAPDAPAVGPRR